MVHLYLINFYNFSFSPIFFVFCIDLLGVNFRFNILKNLFNLIYAFFGKDFPI